jgi:hypothetical protein
MDFEVENEWRKELPCSPRPIFFQNLERYLSPFLIKLDYEFVDFSIFERVHKVRKISSLPEEYQKNLKNFISKVL